MNATAEEIGINEFADIVQREFRFLLDDGFEPLFWEYGGNLFVRFERDDYCVSTWCGKRDADVWTHIDRIAAPARLGLDTAYSVVGGELEYPPFMGTLWTAGDAARRLALEAAMLLEVLPPLMSSHSQLFAELGGSAEPDSVALADAEATFARTAARALSFLEAEYGYRCELDAFGAAVLCRTRDHGVRVSLSSGYDFEAECETRTVIVEAFDLDANGIPPRDLDDESTIVEIDVATGAEPLELTADALDESLPRVEREVRALVDGFRARMHG